MITAFQRKESSLSWLAIARLRYLNRATDEEAVAREKARIERVIEQYYIQAKDKEYNRFILDWIQEHAKEVVYTDAYEGDFEFPEEINETNLDIYTRRKDKMISFPDP